MERLTNGIDYCQLHCDFGKEKGCFFQDKTKCYEKNMYEKLRSYEEAEEQSLLLRLPCRVGDTLYYVDDIRKFVDECKVTKLEFRTMNKCYMRISIEMEGKLWHCIGDKMIGEVAFFTKEEAEQALKRMKGE